MQNTYSARHLFLKLEMVIPQRLSCKELIFGKYAVSSSLRYVSLWPIKHDQKAVSDLICNSYFCVKEGYGDIYEPEIRFESSAVYPISAAV